MPNIGPIELVIILVIALLILGPGRLPDVGSALGKSIREFRKATAEVQDTVDVAAATAPSVTSAPAVSGAVSAPQAATLPDAPSVLAAVATPNVLAAPSTAIGAATDAAAEGAGDAAPVVAASPGTPSWVSGNAQQ